MTWRTLALLLGLVACGPPSDDDLAGTRGGNVDVYFNEPGTRLDNLWEPDAVQVMIETIRNARTRIDMAVMGFTRDAVIDELIAAYDRGVAIRMVGDAGHLYNDGYMRFRDRRIPVVTGNLNHIMHHKFMVVDGRFVFGGTANWTDTDLRHNSNNFFLIDSPPIAADFTAEFEQMFAGVFGHNKVEIDNGRRYVVGDTEVEVWFAPNEDAMGRILELVDAAEKSVRFTIFAFTKDQLGSSLIRKQAEFAAEDAAEGIDALLDFRDRRSVAGMIDQSQLHSNGQYHEVYRMLGAGIPLRMDGNDNGAQPGDYQAGGGRLHSKTMVIDADGMEPLVITGSFNWSASATQSNDEYLLVFHGERIAKDFDDYFERLWLQGRRFGVDRLSDGNLAPGDLVVNEVMWYGVRPDDPTGYDQYVELRNLSNRKVRLDLWQLHNGEDFVVGIPPGSYVEPGGLFTILDHTMERYEDGVPQDEPSAFSGGDMVVNSFNDDRQARLYLKGGSLKLRLLDPDGVEVDVAGDGGPAFFGGPDGQGVMRSMERRDEPGDGTVASSWYENTSDEGGTNVNEDFRATVRGTPDEANSPEP